MKNCSSRPKKFFQTRVEDSVKPLSRPQFCRCRHMRQAGSRCGPLPSKGLPAHPFCQRLFFALARGVLREEQATSLHNSQKQVAENGASEQVQQASLRQQHICQDVAATLLASGSVERSGRNSLVLNTLSGSSSIKHAAHIPPTPLGQLDLTPRRSCCETIRRAKGPLAVQKG